MFAQLRSRTDHDTLRAPPPRRRQQHRCRLYLEPLEDRCLLSGDVILTWNATLISVIEANHLPPLPSSRSLAMLHVAMYDAVEGIPEARYTFYPVPGLDPAEVPRPASREAAATTAADTVLDSLYPAQHATFDALAQAELAQIDGERKENGMAWGQTVGNAVVTWRSTDGSNAVVPYTPGTGPGVWQPTPPGFLPALAPQWAQVTPFAMTSDSQFRPPPPPALDSTAYATAFNEVKSLGRVDSTTRTADQTQIALFWKDAVGTAYAFGHWNQIAAGVSADQGLDLVDNARLFALLNIATADALIACWDAKYTDNFWRPVTAIRFAGDSSLNPATASDPTWTPLIVTPNFPSYTSAHSTVSSAAAAILTSLFGPDYHFTTGSDGLPGVTRSFSSFTAAAAEAGQSRIYGGIHFQFDNQGGQASGHALGQFVFQNFLVPVQQDEGGEENTGGHHGDGQDGASAEPSARLVGILFDDANLVRSLTTPAPAPGAAGPPSVQHRRGDGLAITPVDEDRPMQPDSAPNRLVAWVAHRRVLDRVFASWDGSTLAGGFQSDEIPARAG
jgi:membrane-associated phospholipid phosphatase